MHDEAPLRLVADLWRDAIGQHYDVIVDIKRDGSAVGAQVFAVLLSAALVGPSLSPATVIEALTPLTAGEARSLLHRMARRDLAYHLLLDSYDAVLVDSAFDRLSQLCGVEAEWWTNEILMERSGDSSSGWHPLTLRTFDLAVVTRGNGITAVIAVTGED